MYIRISLISLFLPCLIFSQQMGSTTLEVKILPKPIMIDREVEVFIKMYKAGDLTSAELEWFYWTNYSRRDPRRFWDSVVAPILALYPSFRSAYTSSLKKELYNTAELPMVKPNR